MSYVDSNLLQGEQITYRTKKSLIVFVYPIFWTVVIGLCFIPSNPFIHTLAIAPALIAAFYWVNQYLTYRFSEFAITNIRILMREGFFVRHTNDTRLSAIANVTVNQSLVGLVLNYGTIFINSFGGERDPFREIESPTQFQKQLQAQLYSMQQKPGQ